MNLWTLYRRRKLAYELLAEYDRDQEPSPSYAESITVISKYADTTAGRLTGSEDFNEAVRRYMRRIAERES